MNLGKRLLELPIHWSVAETAWNDWPLCATHLTMRPTVMGIVQLKSPTSTLLMYFVISSSLTNNKFSETAKSTDFIHLFHSLRHESSINEWMCNWIHMKNPLPLMMMMMMIHHLAVEFLFQHETGYWECNLTQISSLKLATHLHLKV